jgi:transcriptional regulator with XRE-family HTH domain
MTPATRNALEAFGLAVRHARRQAGLSQMGLERWSGVDQTTISRFERGLAPSMSAVKLVELSLGLHGTLPLGECPHDHACRWQRTDASSPRAASQSTSLLLNSD